jgi:imidazolonepropionase-like amidohydrolase
MKLELYWQKHYFERAIDFVAVLHQAGVRLLAGTHTVLPFVYPGSDLHHELTLLTMAGLSPAEALQTATGGAATCLGMQEDWGTISVGKAADLVLLAKNPLNDIQNVRTIDRVWQAGQLVYKNDDTTLS